MEYKFNTHEEFRCKMIRGEGKNKVYYFVPEYLDQGVPEDSCWVHCNHLRRYLLRDFNMDLDEWYLSHVNATTMCKYCNDVVGFRGPSGGYNLTCGSYECHSAHSTETALNTWKHEGHADLMREYRKDYWTDEARKYHSDLMRVQASSPEWCRMAFIRMCEHNGYDEAAVYVGEKDGNLKVGASVCVDSRAEYLGLDIVLQSDYMSIYEAADLEYDILSSIPKDVIVEGEGHNEYRSMNNLEEITKMIQRSKNDRTIV